jgi:N-acetylglucosaminyldiphosphoundecaprenol N-acetyl-beta-D-mannosaminyltransferase
VFSMTDARTCQKVAGRAQVFGIHVDAIQQDAAVRDVIDLGAAPGASIVVTANLDHAVRLRRNQELRALYDSADMVLVDGFPLVLASQLRGRRVPGRVTGADLIRPLCGEAGRRGLSIFIVGSTLRLLSDACRKLSREFPELSIAGVYAPSFGFHAAHPESSEILEMLRLATPSIVFVALGSPKQEIWAHAHQGLSAAGVFVCVGAGFDYLAGRPRRAPELVQRLCMEWLWRLVHEPRRLAKRYAINFAYLPVLLAEHLGLLATRLHGDRLKRLQVGRPRVGGPG